MLTAQDVRNLHPGEKVHRRCIPSGCTVWEVREVRPLAEGLVSRVTMRQRWVGGETPSLFSDDDIGLIRWHLPEACPEQAQQEAS